MTIPLHERVRELMSTLALAGHHVNITNRLDDGAAALEMASRQLTALRQAVDKERGVKPSKKWKWK